MIDKEIKVYNAAVEALDKEFDRINKKGIKDALDINIVRCALMLKSESSKPEERELMRKSFEKKYFKKILDEHKKTKSSKTKRSNREQ